MYAIRSKKTNRWFLGINTKAGINSSLRIQMDDTIPVLFKTKEMARIELLSNQLRPTFFDIIEVELLLKESLS